MVGGGKVSKLARAVLGSRSGEYLMILMTLKVVVEIECFMGKMSMTSITKTPERPSHRSGTRIAQQPHGQQCVRSYLVVVEFRSKNLCGLLSQVFYSIKGGKIVIDRPLVRAGPAQNRQLQLLVCLLHTYSFRGDPE